jgi:hypothetical protein
VARNVDQTDVVVTAENARSDTGALIPCNVRSANSRALSWSAVRMVAAAIAEPVPKIWNVWPGDVWPTAQVSRQLVAVGATYSFGASVGR